MEMGSKISGKAPLLSTKEIAMFSGLQQDFDHKSENRTRFQSRKLKTSSDRSNEIFTGK